MDLDDIWDEPVAADAAPRASSHPQQPLFLSDSDNDDPPRPPPQNVPEVDVDINAIFAEVEDDDDPFCFKPLTSKLDTEALRREAEARHKKNMPSLTPHAIMSSSPPRDMGDGEGSKSKPAGGDKGKDAKKERRRPVRLDEGRLLGPTGFPKLIKDTKNFRTKGKGYEVTDLNRVLQVYGYWTHEMYPKTTFRDTVERVEKLCHSKRMHVALSVWRDEAHGLVNGHKPEDDDVIDLTENPDGNPPVASSPLPDRAAYASSSSYPPSHPPSSGTEMDEDDDFDIDAVIRNEEERMAKERAASHNAPDAPANFINNADKGKGKLMVNEDEDATMWEALAVAQDSSSHDAQSGNSAISTMDEDDTIWDELDALQESAPSMSASAKSAARNLDEDEDMWDVVREIENGATAALGPEPITALTEPVAELVAGTTLQHDEDDWDVYV